MYPGVSDKLCTSSFRWNLPISLTWEPTTQRASVFPGFKSRPPLHQNFHSFFWFGYYGEVELCLINILVRSCSKTPNDHSKQLHSSWLIGLMQQSLEQRKESLKRTLLHKIVFIKWSGFTVQCSGPALPLDSVRLPSEAADAEEQRVKALTPWHALHLLK